MHNMKSCAFTFTIMCCLYIISTFSAEISNNFFRIAKATVSFQPSLTLQAPSLVSCGLCSATYHFNCFNFQDGLKTCELGNCSESYVTRDASINLYSTCNFNEGFTILANGSVNACIWVSDIVANFTQARDDCRSKGSYLYIVKSIEKLWILQNNFRENMWIGLNDIDVEGQYIWDDDNTVFNTTWIPLLFAAHEPNNGDGNEDCIDFLWKRQDLNDDKCFRNISYICERPILGV